MCRRLAKTSRLDMPRGLVDATINSIITPAHRSTTRTQPYKLATRTKISILTSWISSRCRLPVRTCPAVRQLGGGGDWDGAPGGKQGEPPAGDGAFNQLDIIAALNADVYLKGPYAAIVQGGTLGDGQTSIVYDPATGELKVDAPSETNLTSVNITSAGSMFIGDKPAALDGAFDNFGADNIFKATFGGDFGSLSFGNVLAAGIAEDALANDLTVVGSLAGGGDLGDVDLVYQQIPEPSSIMLLLFGFTALLRVARRR